MIFSIFEVNTIMFAWCQFICLQTFPAEKKTCLEQPALHTHETLDRCSGAGSAVDSEYLQLLFYFFKLGQRAVVEEQRKHMYFRAQKKTIQVSAHGQHSLLFIQPIAL